MYKKSDFVIPNIANTPTSIERINSIFEIFGEAYLKYNNLDLKQCCQILNVTENTFRKIINHACLVGIIESENGFYHLSQISLKFFYEKISYERFLAEIMNSNVQIQKIKEIILILLSFFNGRLGKKTIVYLICLVSKEGRYDQSAIRSVARNLSPIINMMIECKYIKNEKDSLILLKQFNGINALFSDKQILTVNQISDKLKKYFDGEIIVVILSVVSTFENRRYIWAKSSLYKNQGEICNLDGEFIMSVMMKGEDND